MNPTHIRTENGTPALITARAALDEINAGMMRPTRKNVRTMSASGMGRTLRASIEYRDGRKVIIRAATPEELATPAAERTADGLPIVTVNGKRYIIGKRVTQPETQTLPNGSTRDWPGSVNYWAERNGQTFGATRFALGDSKPGTVGAGIWAAVATLQIA